MHAARACTKRRDHPQVTFTLTQANFPTYRPAEAGNGTHLLRRKPGTMARTATPRCSNDPPTCRVI